jgi:glycerol kinase
MSGKEYVGAIDQGTTSSRFVIFNRRGEIAAMHQVEHRQFYPRPGWVEHDPLEIRDKTYEAVRGGLAAAGIRASDLAAVGLTNQRETTVVWNRRTGRPYGNAIVWQDTRTDRICRELAGDEGIDRYRSHVGLPLATYFSGPKIRWMLENIDGVRADAAKGEAVFGTMDSWLLWWLTGRHATDVTNASRTMLLNLETLDWDPEMPGIMGIPESMLPEIVSSSEVYGLTRADGVFGAEVPVAGILGDQQAALFGQVCLNRGEAKNTYGTGCFLLMNTGSEPVVSESGLLTTVAYQIGRKPAVYALEGAIAMAGSLVQWFRDNFGLITASSEIEDLAREVPDNGGIYFVPAFTGLFAPYWRSDARGLIIGLTHYVNKGHLARAVLEATAFQTRDVFEAMIKDSGLDMETLKVDGGMAANDLLMQFQADILNVPVVAPSVSETTVLGAAYAAGLAVGFWEGEEELRANHLAGRSWEPGMTEETRARMYAGWGKAVRRTFGWLED